MATSWILSVAFRLPEIERLSVARVKSTLRGFVADVPIDLGAVLAVPIGLGTMHGNRPWGGDRQLDPRACDGNNFERQVATWNYDLFANPSAEDEHSISPGQSLRYVLPDAGL
jgi:hypothetical protein